MKRWRGRRFLLNPPGLESTGAIVAEVEDTRGWKPGRFRLGTPLHWDEESAWALSPDVIFQVSDCTRVVGFSVRWESPEERRGALVKVDRMVTALTEFRAALVEEQALYVERVRLAKKAGPPPEKK